MTAPAPSSTPGPRGRGGPGGPGRRRPPPLRGTVARTTTISEHFLRVTVTGDDLRERFRWAGPAAHLKMMIPEPGSDRVNLPVPDENGFVGFDRANPITMRTYTARQFDEQTAELDIDVFLHGTGPASQWAASVRPGGQLAVTSPRSAGFTEDPDADWVFIAGDESSLPAIATIVPTLTKPARVVVELADAGDRAALDYDATWLSTAPGAAGGTALEQAISEHTFPAGRGQIWVATEAVVVRRIRADLLSRVDRDQLTTRGYWRAGQSNHPDHDYGEDES